MPGASYILDKSFKIEDAAGVGQFLAVVIGANDGGCKKPAGANASGFVGFTQESQTVQNKAVPVRVQGISRAVAKGSIAYGDRVQIADNTGKVQSCEAAIAAILQNPAALVNVVGRAMATAADGDIIPVLIQDYAVVTPVS